MLDQLGPVEIYPVGLLRDLREFANSVDRRQAWRRLPRRLAWPIHRAREGRWRSARQYFNGYLAEPRQFPPGVARCGTGWTRGRAYRDLLRMALAAEQTARAPHPAATIAVMALPGDGPEIPFLLIVSGWRDPDALDELDRERLREASGARAVLLFSAPVQVAPWPQGQSRLTGM
ncbi:hypothetical protein [Actinomadura miaoliensis]